jgi:pyruvate-ferredoxin/flavodoxin oxidoreductase
MARTFKTMDGNTAAAYVSYAFTDVAGIYPITPSSTMAEYVDKWSAQGAENVFGQQVRVVEMQSEAGAAGAVHGSLLSGALTTTYTASQGLLLMIPNMYKMAGELLPGVIHVSARAIATHALSIFGDHSDIYACRQTGYAMLASGSVQEVMDLGAVAHLAALSGSVPFLHFFDGFRTSHEMQKIAAWDYAELADMLDREALQRFRDRALTPARPSLRGSAQNGDTFFQNREAANPVYDALPGVVERYMAEVNRRIGTDYQLFNYHGAPDAEHVLIAMGSACEAAGEVVDYLCARGARVGLVRVRLYRPFSARHLAAALPKTVRRAAVLDRTKEPGAPGEPLYLDVISALRETGRGDIQVFGGRYGLASKDVTPGMLLSAFHNLQAEQPKQSFTLGITDDVTGLSVPVTEAPDTTPQDTVSCKFWGLGSDGTVGANKNSVKIIGDHTDKYVQAYFQYDSKKSGGVTISHLRFGDSPIRSTYYVSQADFVACHNPSYLEKYPMVQDVKPGGIFLINCPWNAVELGKHLPAAAKRYIAEHDVRVCVIDAIAAARELGLGGRTNTILQAAFFQLSKVLPVDQAEAYMKQAVRDTYGRKGEKVVEMNIRAVELGLERVKELTIPPDWAMARDEHREAEVPAGRAELRDYVRRVMRPVNGMRGDELPVSAFLETADGRLPAGTSAFEKRGVAVDVPQWLPEHCIQCNQCSYVCPHAVIRPFVLDAREAARAPEGMQTLKMSGKGCEQYRFAIVPSVQDCTGCGLCAAVCPAKEKALVMRPLAEEQPVQEIFDWARDQLTEKALPFAGDTVKGSQFAPPLLEFSGACAGCGETPYAKLLTQLFGERMYVANATGCSSIWGGSAPSTAYTVTRRGRGPAWANSLFEDAAEFGYGMLLGAVQRREQLTRAVEHLAAGQARSQAAATAWLESRDDPARSITAGEALLDACREAEDADARLVCANADLLGRPSFWAFGGDGWAYDIGYGGLDHVLASGENINILVFDTEVYSNTGGQSSKATPTGAVAQFAAAGKRTKKKDLAQMAMSYGYVYVAQVAMGANYQQTLKAFVEAERYDGPSLLICYAPCINHGDKRGMGRSQEIMRAAVNAGYWDLFRFDPRRAEAGENPLVIDSKAPTESFRDFLMSEVRYSALALAMPQRAEALFAQAERDAQERRESLRRRQRAWETE